MQAQLAAQVQSWMEAVGDFVLRGDVPQRYEAPGWGPWTGMPGDEAEARAAGWCR